jgi:hypothetical protein
MKTLLKLILVVAAAGAIQATQSGCGGREKGSEPPSGLVKPRMR